MHDRVLKITCSKIHRSNDGTQVDGLPSKAVYSTFKTHIA